MEQEILHTDHDSFVACETGLISHYKFEDGSGQFAFMHLENENKVAIDSSLSFSTDIYVKICGSCNGMLLLSSTKDDQVCYRVYDSHDNICATLPQPCVTTRIIRSGIIFDGNHYQVMLLHVDPASDDDAKAVYGNSLVMEIFSSETGRWGRRQPMDLRLPSYLLISDFPELEILPLYSEGSIHWELCGHLLVYKVKDGSCELIELPNVFPDCSLQSAMTYRGCLWESEGHVNYTYTDFDGIHTWELLKEEDHNPFFDYDHDKFRWRLTDSIWHNDLIWEKPEIFYGLRYNVDHCIQWEPSHTSPVGYIESTGSMYLQLPGVLLSYNLSNRVLEKVCTYDFKGMDFYCCSFVPFEYPEQYRLRGGTQSIPESGEMVTLPLQDEGLHPLDM